MFFFFRFPFFFDVTVTDTLVFGLLVMSAQGLKTKVDPLTRMIYQLSMFDSSDSALVQHLLTSWQLTWQLIPFTHLLFKYF